eukprot:3285221-Prymnesium_polylepis.2
MHRPCTDRHLPAAPPHRPPPTARLKREQLTALIWHVARPYMARLKSEQLTTRKSTSFGRTPATQGAREGEGHDDW